MNTYSQIGRKVVLWDEQYRKNAYIDQLGISHNAFVVLREFVVRIIEEREVKNVWGSGMSTGWKAITEDGRVFTCNWNSFPDDSMTPTYYWDAINEDGYIWNPVDAVQACSIMPHVDEKGNRAIPIGSTTCQKHNILHLDNEQCWKCDYEKMKDKHNMR